MYRCIRCILHDKTSQSFVLAIIPLSSSLTSSDTPNDLSSPCFVPRRIVIIFLITFIRPGFSLCKSGLEEINLTWRW